MYNDEGKRNLRSMNIGLKKLNTVFNIGKTKGDVIAFFILKARSVLYLFRYQGMGKVLSYRSEEFN